MYGTDSGADNRSNSVIVPSVVDRSNNGLLRVMSMTFEYCQHAWHRLEQVRTGACTVEGVDSRQRIFARVTPGRRYKICERALVPRNELTSCAVCATCIKVSGNR